MAKQKYYVVWIGKAPGVYRTWNECQDQVNGFEGAKFKAYTTEAEAKQAFKEGWTKHWGSSSKASKSSSTSNVASIKANKVQEQLAFEQEEIDYNTISVDVGTSGNPGPIEYKGVDTATGQVLFEVGPVANGTNNLGEYLAIVHALAWLKKNGDSRNIYSDSVTAMKWVRDKAPKTNLRRDPSTEAVWAMVDRATLWLKQNDYSTKIMKWQTERWGEIKADYGRK